MAEIDSKLNKGQDYEALLYSVFSFERMVRRTIKYAFRKQGFPSKLIDEFIIGKQTDWTILRKLFKVANWYATGDYKGINEILSTPIWKYFDNGSDPRGAMQLRNKLAHGVVPKRKLVLSATQNMKEVIKKWDSWSTKNFGYNGTTKFQLEGVPVRVKFPPKKLWR